VAAHFAVPQPVILLWSQFPFFTWRPMIALELPFLTHLQTFLPVLIPRVSRTTLDEIASNCRMFSR
jgi:hypothetical protein